MSTPREGRPVLGVKPFVERTADLKAERLRREAERLRETNPREAKALEKQVGIHAAGKRSAAGREPAAKGVDRAVQEVGDRISANPRDLQRLRVNLLPSKAREQKASSTRAKRESGVAAEAKPAARSPLERLARQELLGRIRDSLDRKLKSLQETIDSLQSEKSRLELEKSRSRDLLMDPASRATQRPAERQAMLDHFNALKEEIESIGSVEDLIILKAKLLQARRGTMLDYYDALSSAASRRREYSRVSERGVDEIGTLSDGPYTVDHIYPRIKIFSTAGFEKLDWDTHIAMFNFEPNLRCTPGWANSSRSDSSFASLSAAEAGRLKISSQQLSDLRIMENRLQAHFETWIRTGVQPKWAP